MLDFINSFLEMMIAERGASKNTIQAYKTDLLQFIKFREKKVLRYRKEDIKEFMALLNSQNLSPRTQARKLSSIKEFFKFLYSENEISKNPAESVDAPNIGKSLPKYLSIEDIELLISEAKSNTEFYSVRSWVMLEILFATGVRISELVELKSTNVNINQKHILVRGKGNKERMIPISKRAVDAINIYSKIRGVFCKKRESQWFFPSFSTSGHITRDAFFKNLKKIAANCGIPLSKVSPHILRHSFASLLVAKDANLRSVQQMLGHSDISTTEIYTHIMDERLEKTVSNFHPLAKKS